VSVSAVSDARSRLDALVLDLDTRGGLAIARSLGRAGLRVAVGARDAHAAGLRTRYAERIVVLPSPEDDFDAYADSIVATAREHAPAVILPCIDVSVAALHRRRAELEPHAAPAVGAAQAVELAISKPRTLALATELGIATPQSLFARDGDAIERAVRELGLPVVVKPEESWRDEAGGGTRLSPALVATEGELEAARQLAPALVQELIPGVRETVKLFRVDGDVIARFAMRIHRTWPPLGGSSVLRESIALPADALAASELLLDAIGLDGYSEVEFRRARDGRPVLMEVNPRLSQSVELAIRAGIDFPLMQHAWARGARVSPVERYTVGLNLGWLAGDGRLVAGAVLRRGPAPLPSRVEAARGLLAYLGGTTIEGFDRADLRPSLGAISFVAGSLRRRETRRPYG